MRASFVLLACITVTRVLHAAPAVDASTYNAACGIAIHADADRISASWKTLEGTKCAMVLDTGSTSLIESFSVNGRLIAQNLQPVYRVASGERKREAVNARYTFFARVFKEAADVKWSESTLKPATANISSAGKHATIELSDFSAGAFHGSLRLQIFDGSPLVLFQAVMTQDLPEQAYSYEFVLAHPFRKVAWCGLDDQIHRQSSDGDLHPERVRYRTIIGQDEIGSIAVFPPPHAFFHPKDEADNFGHVQHGARGIGICQPVTGLRLSPLIDAPAGKFQRMGAFVLLSDGDAASTLEHVKRYTHGDTLKEIDGHTTLITHEHAALTVHDRTPTPRGPAFVDACKRVNVKIIQLAEFHGDGLTSDENGTGTKRLNDYRDMYATCRKYSDDKLLVLPGEEPNAGFPGHWIVMFPKPVYFTRKRAPDQPFKEEIAPYGTVYHVSDAASAHTMLRETNALAWTAHPRIKSSRECPDSYKDTDWYRSPQWLGATWKSMPSDLSQPRLGVRCLDLLDDMNLWGQRKFIVGEFDCFRIDDTSEFYGNINASYLRLKQKPTADDWSPVLDCLRAGDYFVSTGEVLIHSWTATPGEISADIEWTLPLAHAEIMACDGQHVERKTIAINNAREMSRRTFHFPVTMKQPKWVRLEVWDIADDGAFTMPKYLE